MTPCTLAPFARCSTGAAPSAAYPPVAVPLAPGEHRNLVITPHALSTYDSLKKDHRSMTTDLIPTEVKAQLKVLGLFGRPPSNLTR